MEPRPNFSAIPHPALRIQITGRNRAATAKFRAFHSNPRRRFSQTLDFGLQAFPIIRHKAAQTDNRPILVIQALSIDSSSVIRASSFLLYIPLPSPVSRNTEHAPFYRCQRTALIKSGAAHPENFRGSSFRLRPIAQANRQRHR
jgi:hypothetical protein